MVESAIADVWQKLSIRQFILKFLEEKITLGIVCTLSLY